MAQKIIRYSDELAADIRHIANGRNMSENQLIIEALSLLRDQHYMQNKARFITDELTEVFRCMVRMAEKNINSRTNKVLSELAIQCSIQNEILARSLDISKSDLTAFRLRAVDTLRSTQRVLKLDDIAGEE